LRNLSKSRLIAFRQCPKRLWLEVHHPERRDDSDITKASFKVGNEVGETAHQIYDPDGVGVLLNAQRDGYSFTLKRSAELLETCNPIFEAGFVANGAMAFSDVLLPVQIDGQKMWRMVEVKSSSGVKEYYREDAAIQAYIFRNAGVPLVSISIAHVNTGWTYEGEGDYRGLLKENDITVEVFARDEEVKEWINNAHQTAGQSTEPEINTGRHCGSPFECGFLKYCKSKEHQAQYPVQWLPGINTKALKEYINAHPALEMKDVPDELLNELQLRVKTHTLFGQPYFDQKAAAYELRHHTFPAFFLDFESTQLAVPKWKGMRPFQQIVFQFSLHILDETRNQTHKEFIELSGEDPSLKFAEALIEACQITGPIYVYSASFEGGRIKELADRFADLAPALLAIKNRLVDLHPITKNNYYHPDQHGSWSIKDVLPVVAPDLSYRELEGVKDGNMAMAAYKEATHPDTTIERKDEIKKSLLAYCKLDTLAMVRLWEFLSGSSGK
jgi:hypothetical protein